MYFCGDWCVRLWPPPPSLSSCHCMTFMQRDLQMFFFLIRSFSRKFKSGFSLLSTTNHSMIICICFSFLVCINLFEFFFFLKKMFLYSFSDDHQCVSNKPNKHTKNYHCFCFLLYFIVTLAQSTTKKKS